jgi:hypothetical protein
MPLSTLLYSILAAYACGASGHYAGANQHYSDGQRNSVTLDL